MQGEIIDAFQDINPNNRSAEWFNNTVSALRLGSEKFVEPFVAQKNRNIIQSNQPMDNIKASFKDKEFLANTKFLPSGVWNRMLNIIVEEITKEPPQAELKATDSQAISDRKEDIILLKNKHILEEILNTVGAKVGDPAIIVGKDKFKGNIDEFERLGLNANDPEDIQFYEQSGFQRLKYEIAGQNAINTLMRSNKFNEETIRKFVTDILAVMRVCMHHYIDATTGEFKYDYIKPEDVFGIFGESGDGSEDVCEGFEKYMSVMDWLKRVGNDFDWNTQWPRLLQAINYGTKGSNYTGFERNGITYETFGNSVLSEMAGTMDYTERNNIPWSQAKTLQVVVGFIEWTTMESTGTYLARKKDDEIIAGKIDYDYKLNAKETKEYYKENFYQEQMYNSYFLATGVSDQYLFKFGKVYFQQLEGAFDEIAKGTLVCLRYEGRSAAEISEAYLDFAHLAFYRMKWLVYHAKPQDEQVFLPEIIELSKGFKKMLPQTKDAPTVDTIVEQIIRFNRENTTKVRTFPKVDGKPYPLIMPTEGAQNGVDGLATALQSVNVWLEAQIAEKIGLNDMRLANQRNDRQGFKQSAMETQSSLNSTGYVYRLIEGVKLHTATTTLNYAQDVVRFKDTKPYDYLKKLLGLDDFENLKLLGDFSAHRYGIFVRDYNSDFEKQRVMEAADRALDSGDGRGGITISQWGIITMEEDYKKGLRLLNYYDYREKKKLRAQVVADRQAIQENAMALKEEDYKLEEMKQDKGITREQVRADGYKYAADRQYDAKIDSKEIGISGDKEKIVDKTNAEAQLANNEATIELQKSLSQNT